MPKLTEAARRRIRYLWRQDVLEAGVGVCYTDGLGNTRRLLQFFNLGPGGHGAADTEVEYLVLSGRPGSLPVGFQGWMSLQSFCRWAKRRTKEEKHA